MSLTREEFLHWKHLETTKEVFNLLNEQIERMKEVWADGNLLENQLLNAKHVGIIEGINKVLLMEVGEDE